MLGYILIGVAATLNACASVLLKQGALSGIDLNFNRGVLELLWGNRYFLSGLLFFACNVIFYFLALRLLPLTTAYPVMIALSFMLIGALSYALFSEQVSALAAAGYVLIFIGILFVVYGAKQ